MIWLRTKLYAILLAVGGAFAALLYWKGRKDSTESRNTQDLENYHDTRERIDQVVRDADADDARKWLSERSRK